MKIILTFGLINFTIIYILIQSNNFFALNENQEIITNNVIIGILLIAVAWSSLITIISSYLIFFYQKYVKKIESIINENTAYKIWTSLIVLIFCLFSIKVWG